MFGAKYSRLKFWIISICLLIPLSIIKVFVKVFESSGDENSVLILYTIISIISLIWINTLANRIRDYGSNTWISLFALIPLVNVGLAFYYGIAKSKSKPEKKANINSTNSSLTKAVYNHSKDIAGEIKPAINDYKEKHSSVNQDKNKINVDTIINEDEIYEKIMLEIEEDKKVKSAWARALAQSEGNKDKAESLYINIRVQIIKNEIFENEKEILSTVSKKSSTEIKTEETINNLKPVKEEIVSPGFKKAKDEYVKDHAKRYGYVNNPIINQDISIQDISIQDKLINLVEKKGYSFLSKTIVRKDGTWNDYNIVINDKLGEIYIKYNDEVIDSFSLDYEPSK